MVFKRFLSFLLIVSLLVIPINIRAQETTILYNITFEDGYLGVAPSGFTCSENGNSIKTVELQSGYNGESQRCLCFEISKDVAAGNNCYIQRSITTREAENYVFEWWFYPGDTGSNKQVYVIDEQTRSAVTILTFSNDGYVMLPADNRAIVSKYEADVWYQIRCLFDSSENTFDLYVNDELLASDCTSPVSGMPAAIRFVKAYSSKKLSNTYIDSVRIYTGSKFLDEGDFSVPERTRGYADFAKLEDGEVYLNDTFEEQFPYTTQANYTNGRNGNYSSLEPTDEGNVIKFASQEGAADKNMYIEKLMRVFQGKLIIDVCVKPLETNSRLDLYIKDVSGSQITAISFNNGYLYCGSTKLYKYEPDKWYRLVGMFDMDNDTMNYYINGEQVGMKNQSFTLNNIRSFRFYLRYEDEALYYLDNLRAYGGDKVLEEFPPKEENFDFRPITEEMSVGKLDDSVSLFVGASSAYVNGEKKYIDDTNHNVNPIIKNDRTLVPVRFVSESMGADVLYDESEHKITLKQYNKKLEMTVGSNLATKNGESHTLLAAPEIHDGRAFLPLRDVADFLGQQVYWNDMGLIVIGPCAQNIDYDSDKELINYLIGLLIYDRPTAEQIYDDVVKNNPGKSHPRIMITDEQVELLKEIYYGDSDPLGKKYFEDVIKTADGYVGASIPDYARYANDLVSTVRNRFGSLSMAYLVTGEEKYKDEVWRVFERISTHPNWNSEGGIYFGEMLAGVAIAYDWLYDYWTEEQRSTMLAAMRDKAMNDLVLSYKQAGMGISSWVTKNDNFNAVGSTGALLFCIAVMDEPELSEDAAWCASKALLGIEHSMCEVMPDGAWLEGVGYWSYTMRFVTPLIDTLIRSCGTDYGLFETPGFKTTGDFLIYTQGTTGIFNFHDIAFSRRNGNEMFVLSRLTGNDNYAKCNLMYKQLSNSGGAWLDMIHYEPYDTTDFEITLDYDRYFRNVEIASFRSSWDNDANYIAFHGGLVGGPHSEFDAGTFVIDSLGERWVYDLGPDNYSLTDYNTITQNFRHYRRRTEGHNTILFNPSEDSGQLIGANVVIEPIVMNDDDGAKAVMDMTSVYKHENVKSVKRGISLCENRSRFVIRDEIETYYPSEIYWFMHTDADVSISEDKKEAMLSKNGKQVRVRVLEDDVSLDVMDAVPLETSPVSPNQNKNEGMRKLFVHSENTSKTTYTVVIDPITDDNRTFVAPNVEPLEQWR